MARVAKFSDEELRRYLEIYRDDPAKNTKIAALFKVSLSAVGQRVAKLEAAVAVKQPSAVARSVQSVFDIGSNLETINSELALLIDECNNTTEKTQVYGRRLEALKLAKSCLETLYAVQEIQGFMDEVLSVINSVEPGAKERILSALNSRRTLRAAFIRRPGE